MCASSDTGALWIGRANFYNGHFYYVGPFSSLSEGRAWELKHGKSLVFHALQMPNLNVGEYRQYVPWELNKLEGSDV